MSSSNQSSDVWAGREPQQPGTNQTWLWAGIGCGMVLLVGICLIAVFAAFQMFTSRTTSTVPPTLSIPTAISSGSTATSPVIAATATLRGTTVPGATIPPSNSNAEAIRVSTPPTIDGNLDEWASSPATNSAFRVFNAPSWNKTDDLTAVWRLAWDDHNLYIGVTVTDDTHVQIQTGNQIFRGDSLDMQINTKHTSADPHQLNPDDFQLIFSPGNFGNLLPSAFRFQGTADHKMPDAPGGHHITVAAKKTSSGYTLEAAIPWSDLATTPTSGMVLGVALNANDNDTPGTAVQEVMMSHVSTRKWGDPSSWGTLTLK